jgi:iron complex outermembrane receptor protein
MITSFNGFLAANGLLKRIPVLIVAAATALAFSLTYAQEAAAAEGAAGAGQLEEIVVTAEKLTENIQKAPSAITSVSGNELTEVGAVDIREMSGLFPSSRFEEIFGWAHLYVRGIGAEQDRISVDQLVNMFMDGVVLPREINSVSQSDVAAIELLPGPQGTLYGASSVGGVLNIRNNRPSHDSKNSLMIEAGNYASLHIRDAQNFNVNDSLALRASVDHISHSGYETDDRWTANTTTARLSLLYTPSEAFSAYIWGLVYNDDSISGEAQVRNANGDWIPGNSDPWNVDNNCSTVACNGQGNAPPPGDNTQMSHSNIIAGQFDWHLRGLTVTDIVSALNVNMISPSNPNWIFGGGNGFRYQADEHQQTNELKIASDAGSALQWLAGLYLYQIHASSIITFAGYDLPQFTQQNAAPYGQLTYSFSDKLRGTFGARYSWVKKDGTYVAPATLPETSATWSSIDWKAGVEYDVSPTMMVYATAQTGSSPGTLDPSIVVNGGAKATSLTKLNSLTAGWKSQLFSNSLQFNNEFFYYDYKDFLIQTVVCGNPNTCFPLNTVYLNAPSMTSYGDQLDLRWLVTPHDRLNVGYAFTDAKTGSWVTSAGANLSHQTLLEAPQTTATVGFQHSFDMQGGGNFIVRADTYISGGYFGDFQTDPTLPVHINATHQKAYTKTNFGMTYHAPGDKWTLGIWGRNLENRAQIGPSSYLGGFTEVASIQLLSPPRTYGVQYTMNALVGSQ